MPEGVLSMEGLGLPQDRRTVRTEASNDRPCWLIEALFMLAASGWFSCLTNERD